MFNFLRKTHSLADYLPEEVRHYRTHADPEFKTFTYGDIPSSRAANLAHVAPGDQIWFLARLWNHAGARWTGDSDFYFIGFLEIEWNRHFAGGMGPDDVPSDVWEQIQGNAHYRRMLAGDRRAFRILCGRPRESRRFDRALRVTPEVAALVFGGSYDESSGGFRTDGRVLRNKNGRPRLFRHFGSITRAVQCFLDSRDPGQRLCIEALKSAAPTC